MLCSEELVARLLGFHKGRELSIADCGWEAVPLSLAAVLFEDHYGKITKGIRQKLSGSQV